MSSLSDTPAVAMQVTRGVVLASVQVELTDTVLARFQEELLPLVRDTGSHGVILDLAGVSLLDLHEFEGLRRIVTTCAIMGARCVLVGLRPGVVAALVEAGAEVDNLQAAHSLDAAFELLQQGAAAPG